MTAAASRRDRSRRGSGRSSLLRRLAPVWWLGPSVLLIALVIVYPAIEMIRTSFLKVNSIGLTQGSAGAGNYRNLFGEPALGHVLLNTVLWVVLVVAATIVISLWLAQFLNKRFPGRRIVRWALIVPWAASLVMTATVWRYIYEGSYGMLNRVLLDLGIIHAPVQWYQDSSTSFWGLIIVGIIVSIPFSTFVMLAGLQSIPADVYEAARVDGAGPVQTYRKVTFPLLRPALLTSAVLNTIYVFNSFPIIWVITGKLPGDQTDTTVTFMYKIAFTYRLDVGEAAALAVINVAFLLIVVGIFLRRVRWTAGDETGARRTRGRRRPGLRARAAERRPAAAVQAGQSARAVLAPLSAAAGHGARAVLAPRTTGAAMTEARPVPAAPGHPAASTSAADDAERTSVSAVPPRGPSPMQRLGHSLGRVWSPVRPAGLAVIGAIVAAFFLAPYAVMFLSALKSNSDLFHSPARYLPTQWQWGNFASVWKTIPLASYLGNSLIIAAVSTVIVLLVSLPAAYFTARHDFRGKRAFLYTVLVTQMFAPVALVIGIFREVNLVNGAVNSYWAIIAVDSAFNLAFSIWILNGYLASIPKEIEDAAMVDGAGRLRTMFRIVLPLARPGIVTAVIFTFIQVWNEFVVAETIFNNPTQNRETLTVGINAFVGLYQTQYQYLFVASIIGIVPVVILFAFIERYLVSGLTAGSIRLSRGGDPPEPPACAPRPRGGTSPTHRPLAGPEARTRWAGNERLAATCAPARPGPNDGDGATVVVIYNVHVGAIELAITCSLAPLSTFRRVAERSSDR
jgi:multiple sugar transport system permease protein